MLPKEIRQLVREIGFALQRFTEDEDLYALKDARDMVIDLAEVTELDDLIPDDEG